MKRRLHGRVLSRDAGRAAARRAGRGRDQRFHRRLLRRNRGDRSSDVRPGARGRDSRTASSSSTARGPAPRATNCMPTTCRKRSRNAATTSCWRSERGELQGQSRHVGETGRGAGRGAEQNCLKHESSSGPVQLTGRTRTDHIVRLRGQRAAGRTDGSVVIEEATSFTLFVWRRKIGKCRRVSISALLYITHRIAGCLNAVGEICCLYPRSLSKYSRCRIIFFALRIYF